MTTHEMWHCKRCKKKIEEMQVQDQEIDLTKLPKGVPLEDAFHWILFKQRHPHLTKIKFRYHTIVYNVNGPSLPGAANFCAGYRDCGPVVKRIDLKKEVYIQMD